MWRELSRTNHEKKGNDLLIDKEEYSGKELASEDKYYEEDDKHEQGNSPGCWIFGMCH